MKCCCSFPQAKELGLFALRLVVGIVFVYHGWMKLSDIAMTTGFFASQGIPLAAVFAWVVGLVEFLGGLAVLLGLWVRTAALLLAVVMVVALLVVHMGQPFQSMELPLVLLGAALALHGSGAGEWRLAKKECVCEMKKK